MHLNSRFKPLLFDSPPLVVKDTFGLTPPYRHITFGHHLATLFLTHGEAGGDIICGWQWHQSKKQRYLINLPSFHDIAQMAGTF